MALRYSSSHGNRFPQHPISEPAIASYTNVAPGHAAFAGTCGFCSDPVDWVKWQADIVHRNRTGSIRITSLEKARYEDRLIETTA